jgi:hypothetical protein
LKRQIGFFLCAACIASAAVAMSAGKTGKKGIASCLPDTGELGPWHEADTPAVYSGQKLFSFIDGGADIYLEYGFKKVIAVEYLNSRESSIKLEIYEMSDDAAAFGMFSLNNRIKGKKMAFGNESIFNQYYLTFWKNSHLVYLTASDTTTETITGLMTIASATDRRLGKRGKKPRIIDYLPKSGLESSSYLRGPLGLSSLYIFDTKNIFEVREGIVGIYPGYRVFIFNYNSGKKASGIFYKLDEALKKGGRFSDFGKRGDRYLMKDKKGQNISIGLFDRMIFVVMTGETGIIGKIENSLTNLLKDKLIK